MDDNRIRSFGRVNGRGVLTKYGHYITNILPSECVHIDDKVKYLDVHSLFGDNNDVCVEIGSGYGETIISLANNNKKTNFIACEVYSKGLINIIKSKEQYGLNNLKIFNGDARKLLDSINDASITKVLLLFPDPWPKKRHNKRRIVNEEFLLLLNRKIVSGGSLVFASDLDDYVQWTLNLIDNTGLFKHGIMCAVDHTMEPSWWVKTKYQMKAISEHRTCQFFEFINAN